MSINPIYSFQKRKELEKENPAIIDLSFDEVSDVAAKRLATAPSINTAQQSGNRPQFTLLVPTDQEITTSVSSEISDQKRQKSTEAREEIWNVLEKDLHSANKAEFRNAENLFAQGKYIEAKDSLQRAFQNKNMVVSSKAIKSAYHFLYGFCSEMSCDYKSAIKNYAIAENAESSSVRKAELLFRQATCQKMLKQFPNARQAIKNAIKLSNETQKKRFSAFEAQINSREPASNVSANDILDSLYPKKIPSKTPLNPGEDLFQGIFSFADVNPTPLPAQTPSRIPDEVLFPTDGSYPFETTPAPLPQTPSRIPDEVLFPEENGYLFADLKKENRTPYSITISTTVIPPSDSFKVTTTTTIEQVPVETLSPPPQQRDQWGFFDQAPLIDSYNPFNRAADSQMALKKSSQSATETIEFNKVINLYNRCQFEEAIRALVSIKQLPKNLKSEFFSLRGDCQKALGKHSSAITDYTTAEESERNSQKKAELFYKMAVCRKALKQIPSANWAINQALAKKLNFDQKTRFQKFKEQLSVKEPLIIETFPATEFFGENTIGMRKRNPIENEDNSPIDLTTHETNDFQGEEHPVVNPPEQDPISFDSAFGILEENEQLTDFNPFDEPVAPSEPIQPDQNSMPDGIISFDTVLGILEENEQPTDFNPFDEPPSVQQTEQAIEGIPLELLDAPAAPPESIQPEPHAGWNIIN